MKWVTENLELKTAVINFPSKQWKISGAGGKEYNHLQKSKDGGERKKMAQVPITSGYVVTLLLLPVATRVARFVRSMINAFRTTDARHSRNPKER